MRTVASRIQYRLQSSSSFHDKVNHIRQVLLNVLRSAANILEDGPNREAWNDLSPDRQMKLATSLMLALEENAFLLAGVSEFPQEVLETYESLSKYIQNTVNLQICNFWDQVFSFLGRIHLLHLQMTGKLQTTHP